MGNQKKYSWNSTVLVKFEMFLITKPIRLGIKLAYNNPEWTRRLPIFIKGTLMMGKQCDACGTTGKNKVSGHLMMTLKKGWLLGWRWLAASADRNCEPKDFFLIAYL